MFGGHTLVGVVIAATAGAIGIGPATAEVNLKVSSCIARNNDLVQSYLQLYHEPLNKKGKGQIRLSYIGGPEVTPSRRQPAAMQRGLVDIIYCPASYAMGSVPEARLLPLSNVPVTELRKNGALDAIQKAWAQRLDSMIVGWCCTDQEFRIYSSVKPKVGRDGAVDYSGIALRSTELYNPVFKALKATVVTMPAEDIYNAMQRGVVKGFGWPDGGVIQLGVKDYTKYMLDVGFFRGTSMVMMNIAKFKSLPKAARDLIVDQGIEYERTSMAFMKKKAEVDWAALKKAGMQIIRLSPAGEKKFLKTAYDAGWKNVEGHAYAVDVEKLKTLLLKLD